MASTKQENDEPVICRIFADNSPTSSVSQNLPSSTHDPAINFFDLVGSNSIITSNNGAAIDASFPISSPIDTERLFSQTEMDSHTAWIVNEFAQKVFISKATGINVINLNVTQLTAPGICFNDDLNDTVKVTVDHYLGEAEATQRKVLTANDVTQDEVGVIELIQAGSYRAAINLTSRLLNIYGQGYGKLGQVTKHTINSLHLWFVRIALLIKIGKTDIAAQEALAFGNLDKPDLFFQFYPEKYGTRKGSIVPFSFRLLLAELPMIINRPKDSQTKLCAILNVIENIRKNLNNGLSEDGSPIVTNEVDSKKSLKIWNLRRQRVMHSLINCMLVQKNYSVAIEVIKKLLDNDELTTIEKRRIYSTTGRIFLELGDIRGAKEHFSLAKTLNTSTTPDLADLIDESLVFIALNKYSEAHELLLQAHQLDPNNLLIFNNISVCLLYLGKLDEAIKTIENALELNPTRGLSEHLLMNLCTLYELQSSDHMTKKLNLLQQLSKYKADVGMNVQQCLKLQMS